MLPGLLAISFFIACDSGGGGTTDNFDRQAMLRNYADNLILPAYKDLKDETNKFTTLVQAFDNNPNVNTLDGLRSGWTNAYAAWQYANAYNFGPAGEEGLQKSLIEEIGTFPASESKIENAISAGTWNFEDFNRDARGLIAIEYLIFGKNQSADEVVSLFVNSANRRQYLVELVADVDGRISDILFSWEPNYYAEFIQNDGTDVGSSTSLLYNEFVRSYETIKNFKLGLPLGKRPGQVQVEPQLVEAYYSGTSLTMLKAHLSAIEAIWYGRAKNGQDGIGFREYLDKVEGGPALIADTETQLANVKAALAAVPETPALSDQITGDKTSLETLYTELQKMTRFFKSDMSSLLGIAITFSSGDGD